MNKDNLIQFVENVLPMSRVKAQQIVEKFKAGEIPKTDVLKEGAICKESHFIEEGLMRAFIYDHFYHLLPAGMAFADGLGDILTAVLAIPVANRIAKKKPGSITAVYAWNILGMNNAGPGEFEMTIFPFVWFPAFAPANILFLHIAVFRKLQLIASSRQ